MDGFGYEDEGTRSRWLKIGGGVLAGVVLLAAGFGVGRLSAPAAPGGGQQRATVSGPSGPGPTRVENGVPVGYAHTPEGAVAAATNFDMVMNGPLIAQPAAFKAALSRFVAPDATGKLRAYGDSGPAAFESAMGLITYQRQGHSVMFRSMPLTYHIDAYDVATARVSIWEELLIGIDGIRPAQSTWATDVYVVKWVGDDWRLLSTDGGSAGPVPTTGQAPTQAVNTPEQLKQFKAYRRDVAS